MKKIMLAALLLAAPGTALFAQQPTKMAAAKADESYDEAGFVKRLQDYEASLKGDHFAEAQQKYAHIRYMVVRHADELEKSKQTEKAVVLRRMSDELKTLSRDPKANKQALLQVVGQLEKAY